MMAGTLPLNIPSFPFPSLPVILYTLLSSANEKGVGFSEGNERVKILKWKAKLNNVLAFVVTFSWKVFFNLKIHFEIF